MSIGSNMFRDENPLDEVKNIVDGSTHFHPNDYHVACRYFQNPDVKQVSRDSLLNAALGLTGESGEVAEHVKKIVFHKHNPDMPAIESELGDILWYIVQMCDAIEISLEEIMTGNIKKLYERYPDGFDPERSRNRKENDELQSAG